MVTAILFSIFLVLLTIFIHQTAFTLLARFFARDRDRFHLRLYLLALGVFLTHLVEITLYALAYGAAEHLLDLGRLTGVEAGDVLGYFYASAVIYTSLGFGDVYPVGHLRFMASMEALNGLVLIAWSASFLFAAMHHFRRMLEGELPGERED